MMRAAIYARRSTEEHQSESLATQIENARRFIESKGWALNEANIYSETGSRGEFKKRSLLARMAVDAANGDFDVLVVRDSDRLGGDSPRTTLLLRDLHEAGVRVFYYLHGEELRLDTPSDRLFQSIRAAVDQYEREKTAERTYEHLLKKARDGRNAGGRCFGYDNRRDELGSGGSDLVINEAQAAVVKEIYHRFAAGEGVKRIAKDLNTRHVPSPSAGRRGTGSWAPSCIWSILRNERYGGLVIWGRWQKLYRGGTKIRVQRPECDWIRVEVPEQRIIDDDLWTAVRSRIEKNKRFTKRVGPRGPKARHLLSGIAHCECGGPLQVTRAKIGSQSVKVYVCSWHRNRGEAVCANKVRRPVNTVDDAVIGWIQRRVLREEVVTAALQEVKKRLVERFNAPSRAKDELLGEGKKLKREIDRMTEALASTTERPSAVIRGIAEREKRLSEIEAQVNAAALAPHLVKEEIARLEIEAEKRVAHFRALLDRRPEEARKVLEALLEGPLTCKPAGERGERRFEITGVTTAGALFTTESVPNGIRSDGNGNGGSGQFITESVPTGI